MTRCVFDLGFGAHEQAKYELVISSYGITFSTIMCDDCSIEMRTNPDLVSIKSLPRSVTIAQLSRRTRQLIANGGELSLE